MQRVMPAHAGQQVRARQLNGFVVIEVSDQGAGFDTDAQVREDKLGLAGMRERIESLGGAFSLQSSAGGGTASRPVCRSTQRNGCLMSENPSDCGGG